ncbi:MAG: hypothetical protein AB7G68_20545 [Nitrospiraceae bacterium]
MQNLEIASAMISFVAGAGTAMMLYYASRNSNAWRERVRVAARLAVGRTRLTALPLDTHIAAEWTDGRIRLDGLLALIKALGASLDREIARLSRLDPSDPLHERESRNIISPALRHVTFDEHLRNECRMLVPLLEFCGKDLAESQGVNTSEQLAALAEIGAAIQSVDRG